MERVDDFDREKLLRILNDFSEAVRSGNPPSREQLLSDHPEYASVIDSILQISTQNDEDAIDSLELTTTHRPLTRWDALPDFAAEYEIKGEIGRGGMGVVLRAADRQFDRTLAVKVLPVRGGMDESGASIERFLREARITGSLQHPGIPPVHRVGRCSDGSPFFSMKLIEGHTLADLLRQRADLQADAARFLKIFEQIAQTLAYAHSRAVIHRDLKPQNIMVGQFGEVQVMDWGLAKTLAGGEEDGAASDIVSVTHSGVDETVEMGVIDEDGPDAPDAYPATSATPTEGTRQGDILGTLRYMPPEQARGEKHRVDRRSDVFGLGAILCEILTGEPPYRGSGGQEILENAQRGRLELAHQSLESCGAAPELVKLAQQCLAFEAEQRPASADVVAREVSGHLALMQARLKEAEVQRAAAEVQSREDMKRRRLTMALALSVLVLVCGSAGVAIWYQWDRAERLAETAAREHEDQLQRRGAEREMELRLQDAEQALRAVDAGPPTATQWRILVSTAQANTSQANAILEQTRLEVDRELRDRLAEISRRVQRAERDRRMVESIESIALQKSTGYDRIQRQLRVVESLGKYREAFTRYGIEVNAIPPGRVVELIAQKPEAVRSALLAALADWRGIARVLAPETSEVAWLDEVVNFAGKDTWWGRFIDTIDPENPEGMREVMNSPEWSTQPHGTFHVVAKYLESESDPNTHLEFLRNAQVCHPGDVYLTWSLAVALADAGQLEEATHWLRVAVAMRPEDGQLHNGLGTMLIRLDRFAEAKEVLRQAVRLDAEFSGAWNNLALAEHKLGELQQAAHHFEEAIRLEPSGASPHYNLAMLLQDLGEYEQSLVEYRLSIDYLNRMLSEDPLLRLIRTGFRDKELRELIVLSHANTSSVLFALGRMEETVEEADKALKLNSGDLTALNNRAAALIGLHRYTEAIRDLRKAIERDPDTAIYHNNLGLAIQRSGKKQEAVQHFRDAVQLDAQYTDGWFNLAAVLFETEQFAESEAAYRRLLELDPESGAAYASLGYLLEARGELEDAISMLEKSLERDSVPEALIRQRLAFCLFKSGAEDRGREQLKLAAAMDAQQSNAIANKAHGHFQKMGPNDASDQVFRALIELHRGDARWYAGLANMKDAAGEHSEALKLHEMSAKLNPNQAVLQYNLGLAYLRLGRHSEAETVLKRAITLQPGYGAPLFALGRLAFEQGRVSEAMEFYRRSLTSNERHCDSWVGLAQAHLARGELAVAKEAYDKAIKFAPSFATEQMEAQREVVMRALELVDRTEAVLAANEKVDDPDVLIVLARYCSLHDRSKLAVQLADRALSEYDLEISKTVAFQFEAAVAAVQAAHATTEATSDERRKFLDQAQERIRTATKKSSDAVAAGELEANRVAIIRQAWRQDERLSRVREASRMEELPAELRAAWQDFWAQFDSLVAVDSG